MQKASMDGLKDLVSLALELWSHHSAEELQLRVAKLPPYRDIAFFHHLILEKK